MLWKPPWHGSRCTAGTRLFLPSTITARQIINSNWVENGMNALVAHAEKSPTNTIHDIGCSFWFIGSCATIIGLVPNALLIFGN